MKIDKFPLFSFVRTFLIFFSKIWLPPDFFKKIWSFSKQKFYTPIFFSGFVLYKVPNTFVKISLCWFLRIIMRHKKVELNNKNKLCLWFYIEIIGPIFFKLSTKFLEYSALVKSIWTLIKSMFCLVFLSSPTW